MLKLRLPKRFWEDHYDRCRSHPGTRKVLAYGAHHVRVELDEEAFANLKSDADYYGGRDAPDEPELHYLRLSARYARQAIVRQTGPQQWRFG